MNTLGGGEWVVRPSHEGLRSKTGALLAPRARLMTGQEPSESGKGRDPEACDENEPNGPVRSGGQATTGRAAALQTARGGGGRRHTAPWRLERRGPHGGHAPGWTSTGLSGTAFKCTRQRAVAGGRRVDRRSRLGAGAAAVVGAAGAGAGATARVRRRLAATSAQPLRTNVAPRMPSTHVVEPV